jgi:GNAT superfamily N-acetyltransferase
MECLYLTGSEVPGRYLPSLTTLICECFGGLEFSTRAKATYRCLIAEGDLVLAHAAIQLRNFPLISKTVNGGLAGLICVDPKLRRQGLGSKVLRCCCGQAAQDGVKFLVLNCGSARGPFYEQLGWIRISEKARYVNGNESRIDCDPVYLLPLGLPPDEIDDFRVEIFTFGEDF